MDLQEILRKDLKWIGVGQGRGKVQPIVNSVMKVSVS